jgi:hypothetical protein
MYLTAFLTILIFIIFLFMVFLVVYPLKITATFNSEQQPDMHIMISWLSPFLKGYITRHNDKTTLTINLFNKKILSKDLSDKMHAGFKLYGRNYMDYINMAKFLKINSAKLYASYGFVNPAVTGMLCGAINIFSQYINLDELYNNADFFTDNSYFNISADAEINGVISLIKILRRKIHYKHAHALGGGK